MSQVAPAKVQCSRRDVLVAYATVFAAMSNKFPSKNALSILYGHYALETGNGAALWNYNVGNVKGVSPVSGNFFELAAVREVVDGKEVFVKARFRAYSSLLEGVADKLHLLANRYKPAWRLLLTLDDEPGAGLGAAAVEYSRILKAGGYYTADEKQYAAGVAMWARNCREQTRAQDWPTADDLANKSWWVPFACVGAGAVAWSIWGARSRSPASPGSVNVGELPLIGRFLKS